MEKLSLVKVFYKKRIIKELWTETNNASTIRTRRKKLWSLIKIIQENSEYLSDFEIEYPKKTVNDYKYDPQYLGIKSKRTKAFLHNTIHNFSDENTFN